MSHNYSKGGKVSASDEGCRWWQGLALSKKVVGNVYEHYDF